MKKIAIVVLVALALATTVVMAEQAGEQRGKGMMGMMQGMMGQQKSGEGSSESMRGMHGMMGTMMKMMERCNAMMSSMMGAKSEQKNEGQSK